MKKQQKTSKPEMPTGIKPMLATLVKEPFDNKDWAYEVKWDGYRALAYIGDAKAELYSRNNKSFTEKYYPLISAMQQWKLNVVLDGEILVIGDDGKANFGALQNWRSEADGHLVYYAFDILWHDGEDLMGLPLKERQQILSNVLPKNDDRIRLSEVFTGSGTDFFLAAQKMGLEGIMSKRLDSVYLPDNRSRDWLKIKVNQRQEVVIAGYTNNEGSKKPFVTSDGVFRHPSFEGMRSDKNAREVIRETASAIMNESAEEPSKIVKAPEKSSRQTLLNPTEETQVKSICGHNLKFGNLSKVYWPDEGYTKRDMLNYYYQVAEFIMPYLKDRPLSLNRFPNGINGKSFYQKDVKGKAPDWAKTFPYTTSDGEDKEFLVGGDEDTLLWMAALGCIEMNPWFSRVQSPDNPDYCVIDLDPDKNTFEQVIQAACEVKTVLDELGITGYAKTSGSTGIHIYIPLGAKYSYDQSQMFGKLIVTLVHSRIPEFTSLERQIKNRGGKMYLDFLQNRPGATISCPYSLRPKPGATVSMPLHWDEVKKGLTMRDFTIQNAIARARAEGDIFKESLEGGIDMAAALKRAESIK